MPGTRTAPTVGALTVTSNVVSLGLVDVSNDTFSESLTLPGGALTDMADIEAWAVDYQAASNASLWRVTQQVVWEGDRDPDNAVAAFRSSVESGVNLLFKNIATLDTEDARLVAPVAAVMQGNQDIPLLSDALFVSLIAEYLNLLAGYNLSSAQYTGRRERRNNPRIG